MCTLFDDKTDRGGDRLFEVDLQHLMVMVMVMMLLISSIISCRRRSCCCCCCCTTLARVHLLEKRWSALCLCWLLLSLLFSWSSAAQESRTFPLEKEKELLSKEQQHHLHCSRWSRVSCVSCSLFFKSPSCSLSLLAEVSLVASASFVTTVHAGRHLLLFFLFVCWKCWLLWDFWTAASELTHFSFFSFTILTAD